jgi:hypothetical protein
MLLKVDKQVFLDKIRSCGSPVAIKYSEEAIHLSICTLLELHATYRSEKARSGCPIINRRRPFNKGY